ncbi:sensor histidine kinase [Hymenobacter nivis]|uniref:histidine kinase n=1 Tax=Hymenobacter nivis TaxID=1850093 RepID=A0A502GPW6_9BACT|nr:PAS domain-containing sensor histidine kinase [Hymenobacter nivis]TPG63795.1 hypothetical protein EAH73_17295 [Hymenobacter nivis]
MPLLIAQPEGPPKQMYFTFTYQAYRENGEIVGISTFAYDVAPQVLARQEREAQREQLYALFMQAPAAICILGGDDLVYELVNPNYQDLFPGRALLGRSVLDALPEIAGHAVYQGFRAVYATGIAREEKTLLIPLARPSDGALEDRYFNYLQQARRDAHGRIDGVLVFAFEVTEQVRARQASEASARQLRDITDALPVLIGYLDRDEKYRFASEAYRAWFHQDPTALLGQPIRQVAGEIAYQNIRGYVAQALAGERVDFETAMPFRPDFAKVIRTTYVPDVQHGQVVGCYTLVFDITEQTEARRQVESLNQELAAINEELTATNEDLHESNTQLTRTNVDLDNFIYTASHDLKAPISNIEGLLYLLQEELPSAVIQDDAVGPVLTRMLDAVERFKRTIDHLTEVSKLQKEHAADAVAVNLAAVVEDVRQDLLPLLQATGAKLVVDVPALPAIQFSEKNLRSIVYNLLTNAVKYHSPARPPHVDVRAHVRPGHTVFEVHDNGLGIAPDQLPRLFGMFQRFHDHVEGSGIGLYMVKRMVENAGGRIEVHSQLGAGTTFFVFLPHTTPAGAAPFPAYRPS